MEKTAADWSNQVAELDKQIAEGIKNKETIHQAILDLRRKKIELDSSLSKAKYNLDKLKIERSLAMHNFFNARNSGL
jgi:chromosome segregation ATPase